MYLDNFASAERVIPGGGKVAAQLCHQTAEQAWQDVGVISSSKKRVADQPTMVELGAEFEVDGMHRQLGISTEEMIKLIQPTLWLVSQRCLNRKHVQM